MIVPVVVLRIDPVTGEVCAVDLPAASPTEQELMSMQQQVALHVSAAAGLGAPGTSRFQALIASMSDDDRRALCIAWRAPRDDATVNAILLQAMLREDPPRMSSADIARYLLALTPEGRALVADAFAERNRGHSLADYLAEETVGDPARRVIDDRHRELCVLLAKIDPTAADTEIHRERLFIALGLRGGERDIAEVNRLLSGPPPIDPERRRELLTAAREQAWANLDASDPVDAAWLEVCDGDPLAAVVSRQSSNPAYGSATVRLFGNGAGEGPRPQADVDSVSRLQVQGPGELLARFVSSANPAETLRTLVGPPCPPGMGREDFQRMAAAYEELTGTPLLTEIMSGAGMGEGTRRRDLMTVALAAFTPAQLMQERVLAALGARGDEPDIAELNRLLAGMPPGRRAEILQVARTYAETRDWSDPAAAQRLQAAGGDPLVAWITWSSRDHVYGRAAVALFGDPANAVPGGPVLGPRPQIDMDAVQRIHAAGGPEAFARRFSTAPDRIAEMQQMQTRLGRVGWERTVAMYQEMTGRPLLADVLNDNRSSVTLTVAQQNEIGAWLLASSRQENPLFTETQLRQYTDYLVHRHALVAAAGRTDVDAANEDLRLARQELAAREAKLAAAERTLIDSRVRMIRSLRASGDHVPGYPRDGSGDEDLARDPNFHSILERMPYRMQYSLRGDSMAAGVGQAYCDLGARERRVAAVINADRFGPPTPPPLQVVVNARAAVEAQRGVAIEANAHRFAVMRQLSIVENRMIAGSYALLREFGYVSGPPNPTFPGTSMVWTPVLPAGVTLTAQYNGVIADGRRHYRQLVESTTRARESGSPELATLHAQLYSVQWASLQCRYQVLMLHGRPEAASDLVQNYLRDPESSGSPYIPLALDPDRNAITLAESRLQPTAFTNRALVAANADQQRQLRFLQDALGADPLVHARPVLEAHYPAASRTPAIAAVFNRTPPLQGQELIQALAEAAATSPAEVAQLQTDLSLRVVLHTASPAALRAWMESTTSYDNRQQILGLLGNPPTPEGRAAAAQYIVTVFFPEERARVAQFCVTATRLEAVRTAVERVPEGDRAAVIALYRQVEGVSLADRLCEMRPPGPEGASYIGLVYDSGIAPLSYWRQYLPTGVLPAPGQPGSRAEFMRLFDLAAAESEPAFRRFIEANSETVTQLGRERGEIRAAMLLASDTGQAHLLPGLQTRLAELERRHEVWLRDALVRFGRENPAVNVRQMMLLHDGRALVQAAYQQGEGLATDRLISPARREQLRLAAEEMIMLLRQQTPDAATRTADLFRGLNLTPGEIRAFEVLYSQSVQARKAETVPADRRAPAWMTGALSTDFAAAGLPENLVHGLFAPVTSTNRQYSGYDDVRVAALVRSAVTPDAALLYLSRMDPAAVVATVDRLRIAVPAGVQWNGVRDYIQAARDATRAEAGEPAVNAARIRMDALSLGAFVRSGASNDDIALRLAELGPRLPAVIAAYPGGRDRLLADLNAASGTGPHADIARATWARILAPGVDTTRMGQALSEYALRIPHTSNPPALNLVLLRAAVRLVPPESRSGLEAHLNSAVSAAYSGRTLRHPITNAELPRTLEGLLLSRGQDLGMSDVTMVRRILSNPNVSRETIEQYVTVRAGLQQGITQQRETLDQINRNLGEVRDNLRQARDGARRLQEEYRSNQMSLGEALIPGYNLYAAYRSSQNRRHNGPRVQAMQGMVDNLERMEREMVRTRDALVENIELQRTMGVVALDSIAHGDRATANHAADAITRGNERVARRLATLERVCNRCQENIQRHQASYEHHSARWAEAQRTMAVVRMVFEIAVVVGVSVLGSFIGCPWLGVVAAAGFALYRHGGAYLRGEITFGQMLLYVGCEVLVAALLAGGGGALARGAIKAGQALSKMPGLAWAGRALVYAGRGVHAVDRWISQRLSVRRLEVKNILGKEGSNAVTSVVNAGRFGYGSISGARYVTGVAGLTHANATAVRAFVRELSFRGGALPLATILGHQYLSNGPRPIAWPEPLSLRFPVLSNPLIGSRFFDPLLLEDYDGRRCNGRSGRRRPYDSFETFPFAAPTVPGPAARRTAEVDSAHDSDEDDGGDGEGHEDGEHETIVHETGTITYVFTRRDGTRSEGDKKGDGKVGKADRERKENKEGNERKDGKNEPGDKTQNGGKDRAVMELAKNPADPKGEKSPDKKPFDPRREWAISRARQLMLAFGLDWSTEEIELAIDDYLRRMRNKGSEPINFFTATVYLQPPGGGSGTPPRPPANVFGFGDAPLMPPAEPPAGGTTPTKQVADDKRDPGPGDDGPEDAEGVEAPAGRSGRRNNRRTSERFRRFLQAMFGVGGSDTAPNVVVAVPPASQSNDTVSVSTSSVQSNFTGQSTSRQVYLDANPFADKRVDQVIDRLASRSPLTDSLDLNQATMKNVAFNGTQPAVPRRASQLDAALLGIREVQKLVSEELSELARPQKVGLDVASCRQAETDRQLLGSVQMVLRVAEMSLQRAAEMTDDRKRDELLARATDQMRRAAEHLLRGDVGQRVVGDRNALFVSERIVLLNAETACSSEMLDALVSLTGKLSASQIAHLNELPRDARAVAVNGILAATKDGKPLAEGLSTLVGELTAEQIAHVASLTRADTILTVHALSMAQVREAVLTRPLEQVAHHRLGASVPRREAITRAADMLRAAAGTLVAAGHLAEPVAQAAAAMSTYEQALQTIQRAEAATTIGRSAVREVAANRGQLLGRVHELEALVEPELIPAARAQIRATLEELVVAREQIARTLRTAGLPPEIRAQLLAASAEADLAIQVAHTQVTHGGLTAPLVERVQEKLLSERAADGGAGSSPETRIVAEAAAAISAEISKVLAAKSAVEARSADLGIRANLETILRESERMLAGPAAANPTIRAEIQRTIDEVRQVLKKLEKSTNAQHQELLLNDILARPGIADLQAAIQQSPLSPYVQSLINEARLQLEIRQAEAAREQASQGSFYWSNPATETSVRVTGNRRKVKVTIDPKEIKALLEERPDLLGTRVYRELQKYAAQQVKAGPKSWLSRVKAKKMDRKLLVALKRLKAQPKAIKKAPARVAQARLRVISRAEQQRQLTRNAAAARTSHAMNEVIRSQTSKKAWRVKRLEELKQRAAVERRFRRE